ncbi:DUF523 domain-containing protein [Limosilactobacillus antri]|uniref:Uncharacterized protein n=1 Tax=Limosilactobacillus antri DSM 16041 TaxID=525309 RepID=C8P6U0_9LACO|nr:DUF523 domain-containing protein [Limosilactobacillus antri]EEW53878.1 hypothetical protein HMPREF0494_1034 [Limosilactobacillus antri DSM 16041]
MILLSSCLAGFNVRYDGGNARQPLAVKLLALGAAITVCPEIMAGFATPREPAEIQGGTGADVLTGRARVVTRSGRDVTAAYLAAAQRVLAIAQKQRVTVAYLKQKSPACGTREVYDGSFTGQRIAGSGVTAALLRQHGIQVFGDEALTPAHVARFLPETTVRLLAKQNLAAGLQ